MRFEGAVLRVSAVEAVGPGVGDHGPGDHVALGFLAQCGIPRAFARVSR